MEVNGKINLSKEDLTHMLGLPKGVKFIAMNETQHGYSLEVETDGTMDARGFLHGHLQRIRVKAMSVIPPVVPPTSGVKA
jgi:hypothetical protein